MVAKTYHIEDICNFRQASKTKGNVLSVGDIVALKGGDPYDYFIIGKNVTESRIKPDNDYGRNINVAGHHLVKNIRDDTYELSKDIVKIKYGIIVCYSGIPVILSDQYIWRDERERFFVNRSLEKDLVEKRKREKEHVLYYYKFMRHTGMPQNLNAAESLVLDRAISEDKQESSGMVYSQENFLSSQDIILSITENVMDKFSSVREWRDSNDHLYYTPEGEKTTQQNQVIDDDE